MKTPKRSSSPRRDPKLRRRGLSLGVERCEARLLMASTPHAFAPLHLDGSFADSGVEFGLSGTLNLHEGRAKSTVQGTLKDATLGVVPVTGRLDGNHLALNLRLPDGSTIHADGPAVSDKASTGAMTLESQDAVYGPSGALVGSLGIQGPTLAKALPTPKPAKSPVAVGTMLVPTTFTLDVSRGADAGTSLSGVLDLGTVKAGGKVAGMLLGTVRGNVPVSGQFIGQSVQLRFILGGGKSLVGVGPFERVRPSPVRTPVSPDSIRLIRGVGPILAREPS